jgi:glycolate oxidase
VADQNHMAVELSRLLGSQKVRSDEVSRTAYSRDATALFHGMPDLIVAPESTQDVVTIVKYANENKVPLIARGAGSNLAGATVPLTGGIVMSMSGMDKILEISKSELIARVQPGVTNVDLDDAVAKENMRFVPDPGSRNVSTIGGNVATSAGGLRGLKYGTTMNYVLGLEAVLGTGEVIRTGGRLVKNVAGYDLTRLLVGSEGTLAVFTEITLALVTRPSIAKYGVAYFENLSSAATAVEKVLGSGKLPSTLEFLDQKCVIAVEDYAGLGLDTSAGALLLFGDDGSGPEVESNVKDIAAIIEKVSGCRGVTLAKDIAEADALLYARRCSLPALARHGTVTILEDISVPRPAMAAVVERIDKIGAKFDLNISTFGHAGDGNLHPTMVLDKNDSAALSRAEHALKEIFALALEFNGTITGEHGVGSAKLPYLRDQIGEIGMQVHRNLKKVFDPNGILNPNRLGS